MAYLELKMLVMEEGGMFLGMTPKCMPHAVEASHGKVCSGASLTWLPRVNPVLQTPTMEDGVQVTRPGS